jgi:hypothetical protein
MCRMPFSSQTDRQAYQGQVASRSNLHQSSKTAFTKSVWAEGGGPKQLTKRTETEKQELLRLWERRDSEELHLMPSSQSQGSCGKSSLSYRPWSALSTSRTGSGLLCGGFHSACETREHLSRKRAYCPHHAFGGWYRAGIHECVSSQSDTRCEVRLVIIPSARTKKCGEREEETKEKKAWLHMP